MGLPVLNFKFLPDRCHWGRNRESLQPEKEEVAGGGRGHPSLIKAATCLSFPVTLVWRWDQLASYSLQSWLFTSIHFPHPR